MALSIKDLGVVQGEIYVARNKWYHICLELEVPVDTLDSIKSQSSDPATCLYEGLKHWLKTSSKISWMTIVTALRAAPVNETYLAERLQAS